MTVFRILFIHLLVLSPVLLEAAFDKWCWSRGKNDKPFSTYVLRPILFSVVVYYVGFMFNMKWLPTLFMVLSNHFLFFPLIINWILGRPFGYYSDKPFYDRFMKRFKSLPLFCFQVFVFISSIVWFYHVN
jgi:hypothetical protein